MPAHTATDNPPEHWNKTLRVDEAHLEQRSDIIHLLSQYKTLWNRTLGCIHETEHHIELLPGTNPVHQPPYCAGPATINYIRKEIERVVSAEVVEPENTKWDSPVVFEIKKTVSYDLAPTTDASILLRCVKHTKFRAMTAASTPSGTQTYLLRTAMTVIGRYLWRKTNKTRPRSYTTKDTTDLNAPLFD